MKTLMTPREVCSVLRISQRTLSRMVLENRIPVIQVRHSYRFHPDALKDFVGASDVE